MSHVIPTVDLSSFFTTSGDIDEEGKKKAKDLINEACSTFGFFQIVNHGVPLELMKRAMEASKTFFDLPREEKLKSSPSGLGIKYLPAGYLKRPENSADNAESILMFHPAAAGSTFNVLPQNPPDFKKIVAEDLLSSLARTAQLLEVIVAECLGLPPNIFQKFNDDRSLDFLVAWNYFKATGPDDNGLSEHEDGNILTLVLQDDVISGLQVLKDGEWISVIPSQGTLVVNIGDVLQVLSNNKYKSATHRVLTSEMGNRYSYAFFYNLLGEKWVEPLPELTTLIGKPAEYRGFYFKDYQAMRYLLVSHTTGNAMSTASAYAYGKRIVVICLMSILALLKFHLLLSESMWDEISRARSECLE